MGKAWTLTLVIAALVIGFLGAHAMFWWGPALHGRAWGGGPGMMARWGGPEMMGRGGFGPGMMGYDGGNGFGSGRMMWGRDVAEGEDLKLTVDQVRRQFERRLAMAANDRVKLGQIVEKDARTIMVDIVTTDKEGLVQRLSIDRNHGVIRRVEG